MKQWYLAALQNYYSCVALIFLWNPGYLLGVAQIGHEIGFGRIVLLILYSYY